MGKEQKQKLTGNDYLTKPIFELWAHPDFSYHAFRVITAITEMTTDQLESIDISNIIKRGH